MKPHYSWSSLKKLFSDPSQIAKARYLLHKDIYEIIENLNRKFYKRNYGAHSDNFINTSWDTLVILDAARPEYLKEYLELENAAWDTKISPASYSYGFMESEFVGRELHDVVYITTNPYISKLENGIFHHVENLYESAWDGDTGTVLPESVVKSARKIRDEYPEKRYIVHFMQPHFPFLGTEYGDKVPAAISKSANSGDGIHPWNMKKYGNEMERDTLISAYRENHKLVSPYAQKIVESEPGPTVVTADHANLIGERGFPIPIRHYGHPVDFPHPNLTRVPWIEVGGTKRNTTAEEPAHPERVDQEVASDRLRDLGYVTE